MGERIEPTDDMHHALGRPEHSYAKLYRNHFVTDADGDQAARFDALGLWSRRQTMNDGRDAVYAVTTEGRALVMRWVIARQRAAGLRHYLVDVEFDGRTFSHSALAKSRSAARYDAFLSFDDAWNFRDGMRSFLRLKPKVRLA